MTDVSSPPGLLGVDHIHVFVADLRDTGDTVHIALFERPPQRNRSTVALRVDAAGFLARRAHLERMLARPLKAEDHETAWSVYFAGGNPYEITSYEYDSARDRLQAR